MENILEPMGIPQMVVLTIEQVNSLLEAAAERAVEKYRESVPAAATAREIAPMSEEDRYLTPAEAAKMFHVNTTTLWRWRDLGLPCLEIGPRKVLYKQSDILMMSRQKGKHNKGWNAGTGTIAETSEGKEEQA